jgi:hypothetical protein
VLGDFTTDCARLLTKYLICNDDVYILTVLIVPLEGLDSSIYEQLQLLIRLSYYDNNTMISALSSSERLHHRQA